MTDPIAPPPRPPIKGQPLPAQGYNPNQNMYEFNPKNQQQNLVHDQYVAGQQQMTPQMLEA